MSDDKFWGNLIENGAPERTVITLKQASVHSSSWIEKTKNAVDSFIARNGIPAESIVVAVLGSVGRHEALHASDLDVMPITGGGYELPAEADVALRDAIRESVAIKVSEGKDLTQRTPMDELADPESIGTNDDSASLLSRRIMVLTESTAAGGALDLEAVRRKILTTYAEAHRTSGNHVHSFCNDIARYYRTLYAEYKGKVDVDGKEWATRNMKLRHSRKFWYFSTVLACAVTANLTGGQDSVLRELSLPPIERLVNAISLHLPSALPVAAQLLESYAWFLEFMADPGHRDALAKIEHEDRYKCDLANPFPTLKFNSDLLHTRMLTLLDSFPPVFRHRLWSLFLL